MKSITSTPITHILLLLLCAVGGRAQNASTDKVVISGYVVDSTSRQAIPYATVVIEPQGHQSPVPLGQVTDQNGYFRIEVPYAQIYTVRTSFVGMKSVAQTFGIESRSTSLDVGKLLMQMDETMLSEVKVVRQAPLVKFSLDRIAYAVQEDKEAQTKTLLEMLRKVPLVTVDGEGNIQVKGSSGFRVFLNGKPSPMFDQDPQNILRSIPASSIQRIEVITDPGVKYSAEGIGAIINIVTATATGDGMTGTVRLSGGLPWSLGGGLYLALKQGKFGATLNTNGYYFDNDGSSTSSTIYDYGRRVLNNSRGNRKGGGAYGNLLLSYEIDSLNLLTATGSFRPHAHTQSEAVINQIYSSSSLIEQLMSQNETTSLYGNLEGGVDYQRSTKHPGELITLSYKYAYNPNNGSLNRRSEGSISKAEAERNNTKSGLGEHTAQIDYVRPLNSAHNVEVGAKYIHRRSSAIPSYQMYDFESQQWINGSKYASPISQSSFLHTYNIWAGYAAYSYRYTRYALKAGIRLEGGNLAAKYEEQLKEANFSASFFDWIPEFTLEYKPTETQQFKLNYNFRLQRPSIYQLNPYASKESAHIIQIGNPDLEAEKRHRISLNYNLYTSRFMLSASAAFAFTDNKIQSFSYIEGDMIYVTSKNIGTSYGPGFNLYASWSPAIWLRLYTNINAEQYINTAPSLDLKTYGLGIYTNLGGQLSLPKSWTFDFNGGFYSQGRVLQTEGGHNFYHSYGVTKTLFKDRFSIGASIQNPFRKNQEWENTTYGQGFISRHLFSYPARSVSLRLSYRFGSLKQQVRRTQRTIVNDDLMKGGSSGDQQDGNK